MGVLKRVSAVVAARRFAGRHPGPIHKAVDAVAGAVRGRLPDRHGGKVDKGASLTKRALTGVRAPAGSSNRSRPARA